jgi:hypothetical protein
MAGRSSPKVPALFTAAFALPSGIGRLSKRWRGDRGRKLVSLDERLFDDGTMTLGNTITRGFWDQTRESRP